MIYQLNEDSRNKLLSKSKSSSKGRQRFNRRNKSKVANSVRQFNSIDMNKLFKQDILTVNIFVKGETDDYTVRISFGGFLEILRDQIGRNPNGEINLRAITRALIIGFNKDDVFINCSCPDFHYRFGYWATRNKINSGVAETRPSDITNPNDTLGSGCKHILLVLSNNNWLIKVASVINNYIKYMSKHFEKAYADIIYPAIYGKDYEEPVQLTIDDVADDANDNLAGEEDQDTLDAANEYGKKSTQFQKGNKEGVRFAKNDDAEIDGQMSLFDDEEDNL
jgi:hypothetical protein